MEETEVSGSGTHPKSQGRSKGRATQTLEKMTVSWLEDERKGAEAKGKWVVSER